MRSTALMVSKRDLRGSHGPPLLLQARAKDAHLGPVPEVDGHGHQPRRHLHHLVSKQRGREAALHQAAKNAVDGGDAGQGDIEEAKLALEAVGDVVLAAAWRLIEKGMGSVGRCTYSTPHEPANINQHLRTLGSLIKAARSLLKACCVLACLRSIIHPCNPCAPHLISHLLTPADAPPIGVLANPVALGQPNVPYPGPYAPGTFMAATYLVSVMNFMSPMGFSRPYMPPCSSSCRTISLVTWRTAGRV